MAQQTGTRTTFNDTVGLKIDLSDMRPFILTPDDTPLWDKLEKGSPTLPAVKHEWQDDTLPASSDSITAAYTAAGGTITANDYTKYKAGYVLKIDTELFRVTTTPTTSTVTVAGAYAGTSAANHNDDSVVDIIGYAVSDGADPAQFSTTNQTLRYNLMQVFQEAITVSDLNQWATQYGIKDKFTYQVEKWMKVLAIRAEKTLIYGQRSEDSTNNTRLMGGLDYWITSEVTDASSAALTETHINDAMKNVYDNGGTPNLMVISPKQVQKLSGLVGTGAGQPVVFDPSGNMTIGKAVKRYTTDFGQLDVLVDRHVNANTIYLLDTSLMKIVQGQPFTLENLARTGMARKAQIQGGFSFELQAEDRHAIIKNLA